MNGNEERQDAPCPYCALNAYKADQAAKERDQERQSGQQSLAAERAARETAENAVKTLQAQVDRAASEPPPLPGVREFIAHCESGNCEHAHEWQAVKQELVQHTIDNLPKELIAEKAAAMDIIPRTITIKNIERFLTGK
ncbi:MAG: hypothetical protein HY673_14360 [Chloroflexi bacterium]|nr:hypothetical protein [Chloroflexota bacterium]